jgi:pimeloyl-ACP methyl ester carboxylesterase
MLFASDEQPEAIDLFPDGKGELDDEVRRYQTLRLGSRIGFKPPYFYNYSLRKRLHRIGSPALIVWGEKDGMVPRAHGEAYAAGIAGAKLAIISGAGHSAHVERPEETAKLVSDFLSG